MALVLASGPVSAYEGETRKEPQDAGVHQPVLTRAPELLEFVEASYPPEAEAQGLTAAVRLAVTIGADGSVAEVQVLEPVGNGFDEAAVEAVKRFRFSPAEVDHVPSPVQIEYVYNFVLRPQAPDAGGAVEDGGVSDAPVVEQSTLTGQVIARGSRTRVPAATVRCGDDPEAPEALTDENGRFTLVTPAGTCEVRVVATGYELFKTTEELQPNGTLEVNFHVIPQAIGYQTVVRGVREKKEVVRRTLERAEVTKIPGTFGDPIRVVQNLPGVARAPFGLGQLIVRGSSPDDTKTMFDGVEIPLLFHLGGGPSVVNADFLDRVDFYPGGFSSQYGRAIGGIVDVGTRKGASDTWHGSVKVDLLDTGVFVEAPIAPGVSAAAAARRSYVDAILPFVLPNDPESGSILVLPRYWDYQARVDVGAVRGEEPKPGAQNSFYVMAFGSEDVLEVVASGGARNREISLDAQTLFHRIKGDWTWRLGKMTSVFTPYVGYDRAGFGFGGLGLKADRYTIGGRELFTAELNDVITTRAGFDLLFTHLYGEAELPMISGVNYVGFPGAEPKVETQKIERTFNSFDGALFAEADFKLGQVTVTPGLRATRGRHHSKTRQTWEPRLWMRYQPTETFAVKGSVGLYTQPPDASTLENPPFGSPFLVHEKAFQTSLGVEQRFTDAIHADITGYYNRRYDLIVSPGPTDVLPDGTVDRYQYANEGLGRAYGLEVMVKHDVTREFFGWIAYTLNRSESRRAGTDRGYVLTGFDQTHILTMVGSYRLPYGFEVGARFRYVTGVPDTPLKHEADFFQADSGNYRLTLGEPNSVREPPFHQLDLRLEKSFLFESWTLSAYLDIQNVYNATNVEATFTDYRGRTEYDVPGIPFLPVIGVRGSF